MIQVFSGNVLFVGPTRGTGGSFVPLRLRRRSPAAGLRFRVAIWPRLLDLKQASGQFIVNSRAVLMPPEDANLHPGTGCGIRPAFDPDAGAVFCKFFLHFPWVRTSRRHGSHGFYCFQVPVECIKREAGDTMFFSVANNSFPESYPCCTFCLPPFAGR